MSSLFNIVISDFNFIAQGQKMENESCTKNTQYHWTKILHGTRRFEQEISFVKWACAKHETRIVTQNQNNRIQYSPKWLQGLPVIKNIPRTTPSTDFPRLVKRLVRTHPDLIKISWTP